MDSVASSNGHLRATVRFGLQDGLQGSHIGSIFNVRISFLYMKQRYPCCVDKLIMSPNCISYETDLRQLGQLTMDQLGIRYEAL